MSEGSRGDAKRRAWSPDGHRRSAAAKRRAPHGASCVSMKIVVLVALVLLIGCERREYVGVDAKSPRTYCLRNVRVFDAPNASLLDGARDVLIRDGRIAAIAPAGLRVSGVADVDGRGGTLLPGLVDLHVHVGAGYGPPWKFILADPEENLQAFLYAGITTVLDLGNLTPDVFRLRDKIRRKVVLGPHLYAAGPMLTGPNSHPVGLLRIAIPWWIRWYVVPRFSRELATPDAARQAVGELLHEHPDVLKVAVDRVPLDSPRIASDVIAAITEAGHAHGLRTVAHVGRSVDALDAVENGVDALVHVVYQEAITEQAVEEIAAHHAPVVATLSVFDAQERFLQESPTPYSPLEIEIARPEILTILKAPPPTGFDRAPLDPLVRELIAAHEARRRNVAKLRAAGVTVLTGSDSPNIGHFPGASLHLELRALVASGMTAGEALRAATWESAHFLAGDGSDFGEVAFGKRADLLLVAGDPVANIAAIDTIELVILDGVMLERRAAKTAVH